MTTSDLDGNITHVNDSFIQVSGYSLSELIGQPHNIIRHPEMPKAAFVDMWNTLKKGEPWTGIVKNRRKNGDFYWVRANICPMMRKGVTTGYMSIRTKASQTEIATVEPLYQAFNETRSNRKLYKGLVLSKYWFGQHPALPIRWRIRLLMALLFISWVSIATLSGQQGLSVTAISLFSFIILIIGNILLELLIAKPIANIARQTLDVARGEKHSITHLNRVDEIGCILRSVGQLGLICRWLTNDVSYQIGNVHKESQLLVKDCNELEQHTQKTVGYVQQTVATMNQMSVSVQMNAKNTLRANKLSNETSLTALNAAEAMQNVIQTMEQIVHSTSKINAITDVIKTIAFQTNILALNAAVEAARAGDQGKGFAVVADEVRSLANRSASAVNDIRDLIDDCENKVHSGKRHVYTTGNALKDVVNQVQNVTQLICHISHATSEQATGLSDITQALFELESIAQKNSILVEQSANASEVVKNNSTRLDNAVTILH
ncbi:methyl-accepting chemotaxis sensory transducer with Pas/Pac sensor [Providencia burhodogranariea DSM 19968]|uniref:Methyl-accepting chemotaxis sensory transducer with Pas/Pac sensor n=2 Tax=Providencia burhodogranariea TaxID=516074 RepID=K8WBY5_9GAMM|nr:methyl-accepting chemotaxis sensory transducer with Pas/Pac sensor [Providencia burhodogranariea DSM 19968]